jgi:hypothetical protein
MARSFVPWLAAVCVALLIVNVAVVSRRVSSTSVVLPVASSTGTAADRLWQAHVVEYCAVPAFVDGDDDVVAAEHGVNSDLQLLHVSVIVRHGDRTVIHDPFGDFDGAVDCSLMQPPGRCLAAPRAHLHTSVACSLGTCFS